MNVHSMAAGKYPKPGRRPTYDVSVLRVLPLVWQRALQLANGNGSRIQVIDDETVIVWNHPGVRYGKRTKSYR